MPTRHVTGLFDDRYMGHTPLMRAAGYAAFTDPNGFSYEQIGDQAALVGTDTDPRITYGLDYHYGVALSLAKWHEINFRMKRIKLDLPGYFSIFLPRHFITGVDMMPASEAHLDRFAGCRVNSGYAGEEDGYILAWFALGHTTIGVEDYFYAGQDVYPITPPFDPTWPFQTIKLISNPDFGPGAPYYIEENAVYYWNRRVFPFTAFYLQVELPSVLGGTAICELGFPAHLFPSGSSEQVGELQIFDAEDALPLYSPDFIYIPSVGTLTITGKEWYDYDGKYDPNTGAET